MPNAPTPKPLAPYDRLRLETDMADLLDVFVEDVIAAHENGRFVTLYGLHNLASRLIRMVEAAHKIPRPGDASIVEYEEKI